MERLAAERVPKFLQKVFCLRPDLVPLVPLYIRGDEGRVRKAVRLGTRRDEIGTRDEIMRLA